MTAPTGPRLAPLPPERWGDDARAALRGAFPDSADHLFAGGREGAGVPNVLSTLMHHPALMGPFLAYNRVMLQEPALGHRLRELIVLRVAWRTRSNYEWVQHVRLAKSVGVTTEEIDAIATGANAAGWGPLEVDLLAATDQLIDHHRIDEGTWARLADRLDERQLVEVTFVVGTYTCLAMAFNSFALQLDPELQHITTTMPDSQE